MACNEPAPLYVVSPDGVLSGTSTPGTPLKPESQQKPKCAPVVEGVVDLSEVRAREIFAGIGELRRIGEIDRLSPESHAPVSAKTPAP